METGNEKGGHILEYRGYKPVAGLRAGTTSINLPDLTPTVMGSLENLYCVIDRVESAVNTLSNRLSPILKPTPRKQEEPGREPSADSDAVTKVRQLIFKAEEIAEYVENITEDVQL